MPSSSMSLSIPPPPDPADPPPARSAANITTIIEKSEEVAAGEMVEEGNAAEVKVEDVFALKLKQPILAATSAAKRKHSSTGSVEKPGMFQFDGCGNTQPFQTLSQT